MRLTAFTALAALSVLTGCATRTDDTQTHRRDVDGAFLAADKHLYLFVDKRTLRVDGAPFQNYRALMDSPLQQAVACSRLYINSDERAGADNTQVRGSYSLLLHADRVTPEQAKQFGLLELKISDWEVAYAQKIYSGPNAQPPSSHYQMGFDPACKLPATGGRYYSAVFRSDGQWVELPNRAELLEKSRFATPIYASVRVLQKAGNSASGAAAMDAAGSALGTTLGIVALPVTLPVLILSIPFLGPDSWH